MRTPPTPPNPPAGPLCAVLRHPAFDRPPVVNPRGPGRKAGTVSLSARRRDRQAQRLQADAQRGDTLQPGARPAGPAPTDTGTPPAEHARGDRPGAELAGRALVSPHARPTAEAGAKITPPADPARGRHAVAPHEAAVIAAALAILDHRMQVPGAAMDTPADVKAYLRLHLSERVREAFAVMFLDTQHRVMAFDVMFEGTLAQTSVYPREVVHRALELGAAAVILSHNHPSGMPEPSRADLVLTQALKGALGVVDVRVLDHVVIGGAAAVSFAERGML